MNVLKRFFKTITRSESNKGEKKDTGVLQKVKYNKRNRSDKAVEIDISKARKIILPELKFEKEPSPKDNIIQNWEAYWNIYNKGYSFYRRKWYIKAKEEFLKIHGKYRISSAYYTHLLRTYRKIVKKHMEKNKYPDALSEMQEMFEICPNITNMDIKNFNKAIDILHQRGQVLPFGKREL